MQVRREKGIFKSPELIEGTDPKRLIVSGTYASNGATNYNEDMDVDGDGRVFNTDYSAFLADFGSTRIYTEPQS